MNWPIRILFFTIAAIAVSSCGSTTAIIPSDSLHTANNDAVLEIITDELDDLASAVLNSNVDSGSASGGRAEAFTDDRLICTGSTIIFSNVSPDNSSGTVTITFPEAGCKDIKGNIRKGSILIMWTGGKWYKKGATHIITLNNYNINDIAIIGTRVLACDSFTFVSAKSLAVRWKLGASHTLTWPDATTATFKVNKTRKWDHSATEEVYTHTNGPNGDFAVSGTNRHGKDFNVTIVTPLIYAGSCIKISKNFMPVIGTKVLTDVTTGKTLGINYGTGICDNSYILTVDGVKQTLHAKNNSSDD